MKKLSPLLLLILFKIGFSQDAVSKKSEKIINSQYFHNHKIEKYFIHTNKTTYFSGENVWFKTYVVEDGTNFPFFETSNLHLNLYNEALELVHKELVYVENGISNGQFKLEKELPQGIYYIQLDSQWNKNFNKKASIFKIEVLNFNSEKALTTSSIQKVAFVKESTTDFNIYRNKAIETSEIIAFEIKTNAVAIKKEGLKNNSIFAALHRNGDLKSIVPIKVKKDLFSYKIAFPKADAFNGVNTISLFTEDEKVIKEQTFFIKKEEPINISITKESITNDTLALNLKIFNQLAKANVSISVLPQDSKLYKNQSNIISSFLMDPYLKTNNYDIANLITKTPTNTNKLSYITKIATAETTFPYKGLTSTDLAFKNETGISINGKINTKIKDLSNYQVMLSSTDNLLTELSPIEKDRTFSFNKLFLKHPTEYSLFLINEKGKMEKATFFVYNSYVDYKAKQTLNENLIYKSKDSIKVESLTSDYANLPSYENAEALDEVLIIANKKKKEIELKKKLTNYGIIAIGMSRVFKPGDTGYNHLDVLDYMQTLPSTTVLYNSQGTIVFKNDRGVRLISDTVRPVAVILNGVVVSDLNILIGMKIDEIEYAVLNINGAGYGSLYPDGVLNLISKKGNGAKGLAKANPKIQIQKTAFGFNKPEEKYTKPELQFTTQKSIESFSTIDWIPSFEITPGVDNILKINRLNYNNLKLIINGVSQDGKLIYKEYTLSLTAN
jgi:hypothetical protein